MYRCGAIVKIPKKFKQTEKQQIEIMMKKFYHKLTADDLIKYLLLQYGTKFKQNNIIFKFFHQHCGSSRVFSYGAYSQTADRWRFGNFLKYTNIKILTDYFLRQILKEFMDFKDITLLHYNLEEKEYFKTRHHWFDDDIEEDDNEINLLKQPIEYWIDIYVGCTLIHEIFVLK